MRSRLLEWAGDIRAWLLVFAAIRLFGITNPPLETAHNWRQTTVLMVARNFHEGDIDLLHPRVDMAGEKSGITGMEFPLLPAMIAVQAKLFGFAHWHARLVVLLIGTLGIWAFHRLLKRWADGRTAFWSALVLIASLWFMYSRKVMPDVFALSLVLVGLHAASRCLDGHRAILNGLLAAVLIMLGALSKLPSGCLLAVLPLMLLSHDTSGSRRWWLTLVIATGLLPVGWWYFVHVPYLNDLGDYEHFFMGMSMTEGGRSLMDHLGRTLDNFYFDALRFSGFAATLMGLAIAIRRRMSAVLWCALACSIAFAAVMLKAGEAFWKHAYYVLPFVPVMAMLAGVAIAAIPRNGLRIAAAALLISEGLANQWNDFRISPAFAPQLGLEAALDRVSAREDLIVVNSAAIPTPLYMAHRKGWTATSSDMMRPAFIDSLAALGCRHAVVLRVGGDGEVSIDRPVEVATESFVIHGLGR
ncbi:MAG TPA: glycosyltransferase family 39 protein [Flavobacteriales bacterium]|nr:glycosyltransferase family 39 protein [Flavobacteriales bacterium]